MSADGDLFQQSPSSAVLPCRFAIGQSLSLSALLTNFLSLHHRLVLCDPFALVLQEIACAEDVSARAMAAENAERSEWWAARLHHFQRAAQCAQCWLAPPGIQESPPWFHYRRERRRCAGGKFLPNNQRRAAQ
jgi:hypothetical protein